MVLSFNRPSWVIEFRRERLPRALVWSLLAALAAFFAYVYLADGLPPYGICYESRGVTKPCGPVTAKAVNESAIPIARGR